MPLPLRRPAYPTVPTWRSASSVGQIRSNRAPRRAPVIISRVDTASEAAGAGESRPRFHLRLVAAVLSRPRRAFGEIARLERPSWVTPLLLLSVAALFPVLATGRVRQQAGAFGPESFPPDFQYYSAEQQAQFMQALESTRSPTFLYLLPGVGSVAVIWLGWLITGGVLHLISTILGGRSTSTAVLNITAWAGLPFAVRFLIRGAFILLAGRAISAPGLAGFIGADSSGMMLFTRQVLGLIDVYLLWHIALLGIGLTSLGGLSRGKVLASVLGTEAVAFLVQAIPAAVAASFASLTIVRPFYF